MSFRTFEAMEILMVISQCQVWQSNVINAWFLWGSTTAFQRNTIKRFILNGSMQVVYYSGTVFCVKAQASLHYCYNFIDQQQKPDVSKIFRLFCSVGKLVEQFVSHSICNEFVI